MYIYGDVTSRRSDLEMESGRLFFDPSCHGNMLLLGNVDPIFRGASSVMNVEEASKRRPFFSTTEDLYDDEYYGDQSPEKKRRLTPEQVHLLEKSFETENKLEPERKTELAKKLGLQPRQVAIWFQNRRARWKTKQLERDYDQLKASYDSLLSSYDSIHKENEKLKAEVQSLTGKLEAGEANGEPPKAPAEDAIVASTDPSNVTKVEDRLSSGSGSSAVVDEDGRQLVDSGDSDFPNDDDQRLGCGVAVAHVEGAFQTEEDDTSDDGQNYLSSVFVVEQHEGEPMGWWVWS